MLLNENHAGQTTSSSSQEGFAHFQHRLDEWQKAIDTEFQFPSTGNRTDEWNQKIRTLLHLREKNLRIIISQFLLFEKAMPAMPETLGSALDVAIEIGQLIGKMDSLPKECSLHKANSDYFLATALGVSLLALSQHPSTRTSTAVIPGMTSISPETFVKAKQAAIVCLTILHGRAKSSSKSGCLWERIHRIVSQRNLLEGPFAASTASVAVPAALNQDLSFDPVAVANNMMLPDLNANADIGSSSISRGFNGYSSNLAWTPDETLDPYFMLAEDFGNNSFSYPQL